MADFDPSQVMSMLPQILAAIANGQLPGGSQGGYQSRGATFNTMGGGFSTGLGAGADMALMALLPQELAGRLQSSAGIQAGNRTQQALARQAMMEINILGGGQALVKNLGVDPNSQAGQLMSVMGPTMAMASPFLQQAMYATTPTAMFTGGQNIVNAMQLSNPMSDIRPGQAAAIRESFYRLGTNGAGLLDTRFTHGMNLDDLAQVAEFTADMGDAANDIDVKERRQFHRERLRREKYKGTLTGDQESDLEAEVTESVSADRLTTGASYNAQVAKAMRGFIGGNATTGDALNMMRETGMSAQTQKEAINLEELVRNLEALGKQAGLTTQDMVNAGRVLTAQNGGSMTYNMAVAGQAQAAERFMAMDARAKGLDTNAAMGAVVTNEVQGQNARFQNGGYNRALTAAYATSDAYRERISKAYSTGDTSALQAISQEVLRGSTESGRAAAGAYNMSADRRAALQNEMFQKYGMKMLEGNSALILKDTLGRLGGYEGQFGSLLRNASFQRALAENRQRGGALSEVASQFGVGGSALTRLSSFLNADATGQQYATAVMSTYRSSDMSKARNARAEEQSAIASIEEVAQAAGAGQGIFQNIKHGSIGGWEDALVAAGYSSSEARAQVEATLSKTGSKYSDSYKKKFVAAMSKKFNAIADMQGDGSIEAKDKSTIEMAEADDVLQELGVHMKDTDQIKKWTDRGHASIAKRQQNISGTAETRASGQETSSPAGTVKVDGRIVLTVLAPDGSHYPDDKWRIEASRDPGQVRLVKPGDK